MREALDCPTMYNKQNTTIKTTLQPVVSLLQSSKYALMNRTQGLSPGLWKSIAPLGLIIRLAVRTEK